MQGRYRRKRTSRERIIEGEGAAKVPKDEQQPKRGSGGEANEDVAVSQAHGLTLARHVLGLRRSPKSDSRQSSSARILAKLKCTEAS
jgi:hypothetical protein